MKRTLITLILGILTYAAFAQPSIPTRLFDVRNGNGVVDSGTTYPQAIVIVFKDKASADAIFESFGNQYNYQSTLPDPADPTKTIANLQTLKQFTMARLTSFIKEVHVAAKISAATEAARSATKATVDSVVPPQ